MLPNIPKIDNTQQDENDEMDAVSLYSHQKCYVNVMPFLILFSVTSALIHYIISLHYACGNLTTE